MKVIVIGAGPAGMAAAHAAVGLGCDVRIIAPKQKTPQNGPIFLNSPIPGISTDHPQGFIKQLVIGGSIVDYGIKLYGDVNISVTREGRLREGIHTWNIREAYDKMWDLYSNLIEDGTLMPWEVGDLSADLIISTAPAPYLCLVGHSFVTQKVAMVFHSSYPDQPENTVIFNAYPDVPWVRSARMFGHGTTEYKMGTVPDGEEYRVIRKPVRTDCNCHPHVLRAGRFGEWNNMAWIDSAYLKTRTAICEMQRAHEWEHIK